MSILAPRTYERDEEQRLHDRLNHLLGQALDTVDAAVKLRSAPGEAKRQRQYMRKSLETAANNGMDALAHSLHAKQN